MTASTTRDQWQSAFRDRLRQRRADPDPAALIAAAAAREKPLYRSYDTYLWPTDKLRVAAEDRRTRSDQRHAAIVAAGEKPCTICGAVLPLDRFNVKPLPDGRPRYRSQCRSCDSVSRRASRQRIP